MDINVLMEYSIPIIVIACYVISEIVKKTFTSLPTKYIPAICGVLGILFNVWFNMDFTFMIVLGGLVSGWAASGAYDFVTKTFAKK